jgi:hypothetical protein
LNFWSYVTYVDTTICVTFPFNTFPELSLFAESLARYLLEDSPCKNLIDAFVLLGKSTLKKVLGFDIFGSL